MNVGVLPAALSRARSIAARCRDGAKRAQPNRISCRNRNVVLVLAQSSHDASGRRRPERLRDDVGIEQVFHNLQPDVAARCGLARPRE